MENSQATQSGDLPQSCNPLLTLGARVRQGTTLTILALAAAGSGLAFGWGSLAALGLTTVIVSLLPCLAMCALGVCASRMGQSSGTTPRSPADRGVPPDGNE